MGRGWASTGGFGAMRRLVFDRFGFAAGLGRIGGSGAGCLAPTSGSGAGKAGGGASGGGFCWQEPGPVAMRRAAVMRRVRRARLAQRMRERRELGCTSCEGTVRQKFAPWEAGIWGERCYGAALHGSPIRLDAAA